MNYRRGAGGHTNVGTGPVGVQRSEERQRGKAEARQAKTKRR
jgi:hypothetical protein